MIDSEIHVWLLQHVHVMLNGDEDVKVIGIFRSHEDASLAADALTELPGFKEAKDGFYIDKYTLNKINWREGYFTTD